MGCDGFHEKLQRVAFLEPTGAGNGEEAGRHDRSAIGLVAKANLAPQNGDTDRPFGGIVGRLHPFVVDEGEKVGAKLRGRAKISSHFLIARGCRNEGVVPHRQYAMTL